MRSYVLPLLVVSNSILFSSAQAAIVINITESGSDVAVSGSGSYNLGDLTAAGNIFSAASVTPSGGNYRVIVDGTNAGVITRYDGASLTGPDSIGDGTALVNATSGTGDLFGFWGNNDLELLVPNGYTSGAALEGTSTYTNSSFDSMGLTEGTYTFSWGSGGNADTLTVNVGDVAIPEPGSLLLGGLTGTGMALGVLRRRRRRKPAERNAGNNRSEA